jgi:hypothetical protein
VNANAPVLVAGKDIYGGNGSANQTATNSADAFADNWSLTLQLVGARQQA